MKHSVLTLGGVKGWGVGGRAVGGLGEGRVGGSWAGLALGEK